jgi:hypothetical protein
MKGRKVNDESILSQQVSYPQKLRLARVEEWENPTIFKRATISAQAEGPASGTLQHIGLPGYNAPENGIQNGKTCLPDRTLNAAWTQSKLR